MLCLRSYKCKRKLENLHSFLIGCSNFVSMDGIWKLRYTHCMYPVKSEVCGLPTLNYPSVCTQEPVGPQSALCSKHCVVARSKGIPTELRSFVYDYCGVSQAVQGRFIFFLNNKTHEEKSKFVLYRYLFLCYLEDDPESVTITEVAQVEETLKKISSTQVNELTPSTVAEAQGIWFFY